MKNIGFKILIIILLIPFLSIAFEGEGKYKKTKTYRETYQIEDMGKVRIDNSYGNINISSWNKNEVSITAVVSVDGNDLESVQEQIDAIYCEIERNGNEISAVTHINSRKKRSWSLFSIFSGTYGKNLNFKINYDIKIPLQFDLQITNDYGKIFIDRLQGELRLKADYGGFEIGQLLSENNRIETDYFSKSSIDFIKGGTINADYSGIRIYNAYQLSLQCDYSNVIIENVRKLSYNNDYGSIQVNNGKEITGKGDYQSRYFSGVHSAHITGDYGSLKIENILPGFDRIDIESDYVNTKIFNNNKVAFRLEIELEYGNFSYKNLIVYKDISDNYDRHIWAYYADENATGFIRIKQDYGNILVK